MGCWRRCAEAPLEAAIQTLLRCMAVQVTADAAAASFRNLCVRCTSKLQDGSILISLIDAVRVLLSQGDPSSALLHSCIAVDPSGLTAL